MFQKKCHKSHSLTVSALLQIVAQFVAEADASHASTGLEKYEKRTPYTEKKLAKIQKKGKMAVLWQKLSAIGQKGLYCLELRLFDRKNARHNRGAKGLKNAQKETAFSFGLLPKLLPIC